MFRLPQDFVPFQSRGAFRNYERNLPHWRQPHASYFLTFRMNDALPAEINAEMRYEQDLWRERIARERARHGDSLPPELEEEYEAFKRRTGRRLERVLDEGHGSCMLRESSIRKLVEDALLHFHGERYEMHGFVIMPNHVHLAVKPLHDWQPEQLLHSWKRFTSRAIHLATGGSGQFWQEDTWNRIIRDAGHWEVVMRYMVANPARAKLWHGQSTVWVNPLVRDDSSAVREEAEDDPW